MIVPGEAHHITQRGNNRQVIFEKTEDYSQYCDWINQYAEKNGIGILAYCLMTNHVHFVIIPEDEVGVSRFFNAVHMRYAQYMNKKRKTSGHLWQGRFYSCVMDEVHLYRAMRYVECNPVRSHVVKTAGEYSWSSARKHLGRVLQSDIFLKDTTMVDKTEWKQYLKEQDEQFASEIRLKTRQGFALGGVDFISKMEERIGRVLRELKAGRPKKEK